MFFAQNYFVATSSGCDAVMVTAEVRGALKESKIKDGLACLSLPQAGAGWALLEPLAAVIEDLKSYFTTIQGTKGLATTKAKVGIKTAPLLQGVLLHPQLVLPVAKGEFVFDPKLEIYLFDFTDAAKRREFWVHISGEGAEERRAAPPPTRR